MLLYLAGGLDRAKARCGRRAGTLGYRGVKVRGLSMSLVGSRSTGWWTGLELCICCLHIG